MLPRFAYLRPRDLDEALAALAEGTTLIHGGGSDLLGCLHDRVFTTEAIVSLSQLDGLRGISATPDGGLRPDIAARIA